MTHGCKNYKPDGTPMKENDQCQNCKNHIPENDWTGKTCCKIEVK